MNLFSVEFRREPFAAYSWARHAAPLIHFPQPDLWAIFDYSGVKRALTDHEAFSSNMAKANRPNPAWMVFLDPPRHSKLRALVSRAFTPRMVAELEPRIERLTSELLDSALEKRTIDIVADLAEPLPVRVIAEMLGLPSEEWRRFRYWSNAIVASSSLAVVGGEQWMAAVKTAAPAGEEMKACLDKWVAKRRSAPKNDLLTALALAEVDGETLSEREIFGFVQLLLIAGTETTASLIPNAILCLAENPDQLAQLRRSPESLPAAIEEVLRYRSPLQWMLRVTAREVEMSGQTIPSGKLVLAVIGSANRDARYFTEPERFDIARDSNQHLAFGHGIHFCLGAPLARLESRVVLRNFLERVESFELAEPAPWQPCEALHLHAPARLAIHVSAPKRARQAPAG